MRFARAPRSEHDAQRPLQPSDDLARIFSWQETRLVSKSLTLNYKRVLYVLDPTDAARAARGKRVGIEEREDGSLSFWHCEHALLATAFPKEHGVQQGEVVMAFNFLHLLEDIPGAVRRVGELLKPGGLFLSKTVCLAEQSRLWSILLAVLRPLCFAPYLRCLKVTEFDGIITGADFEIPEAGLYPPSPPSRFVVARKS